MKKFLIINIIVFAVLAAVFYVMKTSAPEFHSAALQIANLVMAALSLSSYFIVKQQMNGRAQAFVRGVSGASFLKLMVCMIAALVYILLNRSHIHKGSVFVMFGIYAVYTVTETIFLSKLARE